ncbi:putative ArsR-family transcriptional regulator [Mycolicibacterium canariasense]|uniref:Putative ArsR-family transcriptional regulator n=1 Tax=Mycolicibacterium canariasense TaxID=228230 RepID=A0A100WI34_MYCCR|nr:hypothetical protein AWB94_31290 [Mycolicibacterium canariasense]GAS98198.1 putative ArsR-family transcriptional regulator [Mycolicibacterium canariasense]
MEAHATQEADGSLTDVCIRAEIDAWDWGWQHECWDTMLTPEQARAKGAEMRANAEKMIRVADAFDAAAADAERWVAER